MLNGLISFCLGRLYPILGVGLFCLLACTPKLDSLYYDEDYLTFKNWNQRNSLKIMAFSQSSFKIGLISDSHQNYQPLEEVVGILNHRGDVDFSFHLGDFTDSGLAIEYGYFLGVVEHIQMPLYVLVGNHDSIGLGKELYQKVFGSPNRVVDMGWLQFVLFNNNRLEWGHADFKWLEQALIKNPNALKIVMVHVNYQHPQYFSGAQISKFRELMEKYNVAVVVNGHRHNFALDESNSWKVIQIARTDGVRYSMLTVEQGIEAPDKVKIDECQREVCHERATYSFP